MSSETELFSIPAFAQSGAIVKAVFTDSKTGDPVEFATVTLSAKGSESVYKYVLTDNKGTSVFSNVSYGTYLLKCELIGYESYSQEIKVDKPEIVLGKIKIAKDIDMLESAVVTAVGNPITIDFTDVHDYKFSQECIDDGIIMKMGIYGPNGSGKMAGTLAIYTGG